MNKRLLFFGILLFGFTASLAAQTVTFYGAILKPATVTLPERTQKIYLTSRDNEKHLRTDADVKRLASLTQLKSLLESTGRYTIELAETDAPGTPGTNAPALLDWKEAARITRSDTTALLIVLEQYSEYSGESGMQEKRLWRVYDPATQSLRDEFEQHSMVANSVAPAVEAYADRIMMHWEWVQRDYFKNGNARMKEAHHRVDAGNWAGAATLWKGVARDSLKNPKTAAKACYNMAVYCELDGDIAGAQQWIARSQRLGNVMAVYYGRILRERTGDTAQLTQQLAYRHGQIPLQPVEHSFTASRKSPSQLSTNRNFLEKQPNLTAEELERRRMHEQPPAPNR